MYGGGCGIHVHTSPRVYTDKHVFLFIDKLNNTGISVVDRTVKDRKVVTEVM